MKEYKILNTRAPRVDANDKVTGKAKYTDDLAMPGMLYGAILHSPQAHAKIISIDTTAAENLTGVFAVITHKDAHKVSFG
ncbi:4-hydroxybenzoyl-CoA reductase, partial [bacterium]|nr:4-hydroxybenzoyl-CoA reductase [bacterium]